MLKLETDLLTTREAMWRHFLEYHMHVLKKKKKRQIMLPIEKRLYIDKPLKFEFYKIRTFSKFC